jgi:hypothetical protein
MLTIDHAARKPDLTAGRALALDRLIHRQPQATCEVASALWQALAASLVVIIGQEGFNALYDRCLHEASRTFNWLSPEPHAALSMSRLEQLGTALASQAPHDAARATVLQLSSFTDLLSSLIGAHLTDHILRAAWGDDFDHTAPESAP